MTDFRARSHGLNTWANMRLCAEGGEPAQPNILDALFKGTTMKVFLEKIMGKPMRRMTTFEGISKQQKLTRADWFVSGLQECGFLSMSHRVDKEFFVESFGEEVFPVLWSVANYDIKYCWCVCPDMMSSSPDILLATPLAFMTGEEPSPNVQTPAGQARVDRPVKPDAEDCLFSMARSLLKATKEGCKMEVEDLSDFADCKILCAMVNALVPEMFTSEVMLSDRWTLNLIVKCLTTLFQTEISVDSQDFVEADEIGLSSFLAVFFMRGFQLRQSLAVMTKQEHFEKKLAKAESDLSSVPSPPKTAADINLKAELAAMIADYRQEIIQLSQKFNVEECRTWSDSVEQLQAEVREEVAEMVEQRFDVLEVPGDGFTINDFVDGMGINLMLTGMVGFYTTASKEIVYPGRRVVVQDLKTGDFYDNFTGHQNRDGRSVYDLLGVPAKAVSTVRADLIEGCKVFFESLSRNRILLEKSQFLYQVFPGTAKSSEHLLLHASKQGNEELVKKLMLFFNFSPEFINCRDPNTGNTPLHLASRHGYEDLVLYFLENGAALNSMNRFGNTPLFLAADKLSKPICQLLLEWGASATIRNQKSQSVLDTVKNGDLRSMVEQYSAYYQILRTSLSSSERRGDPDICKEILCKVLEQHRNKDDPMMFANLTSRCVAGQSLLHIAASLGDAGCVKMLLDAKVPIDVLDNKDRTPLHCSASPEVVQLLVQAGGAVDQLDKSGNSPLHNVCCLQPSADQLECVKELLAAGADVALRNDDGLMALHNCARLGNMDAMAHQMAEQRQFIMAALCSDDGDKVWSLIHMALDKTHFECAEWLAAEGITLKHNEVNGLVMDIFSKPFTGAEQHRLLEFLLCQEKTWKVNSKLSHDYRALHFACNDSLSFDIVELLLTHGAEVGLVNGEGRTALHISAHSDSPYTAALLIEKGADIMARDQHGLTPFDLVQDYQDWMNCGYFHADIVARLAAYNMKQSRDLVRVISSAVRPRRDLRYSAMAGGGGNPCDYAIGDLRSILQSSRRPPTMPFGRHTSVSPSQQQHRRSRGVTTATDVFPLPSFPKPRSHGRTLSAPATISTTHLPPVQQLKPRSRQLIKSVVGI